MVTDYKEEEKTEGVIEAFETQFSYLGATLDVLTTKDRHHNYTWDEKKKNHIVSTVSRAMEDVADEYGIDVDIDYDIEGETIQKFEYQDEETDLEITMQCSDKYMNTEEKVEGSRYEKIMPGVHVMVESTDQELVQDYDEKLEDLNDFMSGMFA